MEFLFCSLVLIFLRHFDKWTGFPCNCGNEDLLNTHQWHTQQMVKVIHRFWLFKTSNLTIFKVDFLFICLLYFVLLYFLWMDLTIFLFVLLCLLQVVRYICICFNSVWEDQPSASTFDFKRNDDGCAKRHRVQICHTKDKQKNWEKENQSICQKIISKDIKYFDWVTNSNNFPSPNISKCISHSRI